MSVFQQFLREVMLAVDRGYRRRRRLQPVGPVLLVGRESYDGPAKTFPDGTTLAAHSAVGTLHFNNEFTTALVAPDRHRFGLKFGRLMRASMTELARLADGWRREGIEVYRGVTWLRPHGLRVGFTSEPFPEGLRRNLLIAHFRLLAWMLGPAGGRPRQLPEPRVFWITRNALEQHFGSGSGAS
jgi:hypothetical protein